MNHFILNKQDYYHKLMMLFCDIIADSTYFSKFINDSAIPINHKDYVEIVIINSKLLLIDNNGLQYDFYSHTTIEDLFNIFELIQNGKVV